MKQLLLALYSIVFTSASFAAPNIQSTGDIYSIVDECRAGPSPIATAVKLGRHDVVMLLIDFMEDPNLSTPSRSVWHETSSERLYPREHDEPGYSPLELAIAAGDIEMIHILTSYNKTNTAHPEYKKIRYQDKTPYPDDIYNPMTGKWVEGEKYLSDLGDTFETSPLIEALATQNVAIIDVLIRSYTDPQWLFADLSTVRKHNSLDSMKSWISHNIYLWTGEQKPVSDETAHLFLTQDLSAAILEMNHSAIEIFLANGWIISDKEFAEAVNSNDSEIIRMVNSHTRREEGLDKYKPLLSHENRELLQTLYDKADEAEVQGAFNLAAEGGSVWMLTFFLENGRYFEGGLVAAIRSGSVPAVELLLQQAPITSKEIEEAKLAAYKAKRYDILELLS